MNKGARLITQGEKEVLVRNINKRMKNFSQKTLGRGGLRLTPRRKIRGRRGRGPLGLPFFDK